MDSVILANGAAQPDPVDSSGVPSNDTSVDTTAVDLSAGASRPQFAVGGPDLINGLPVEPPIDRAEQAELIGGSARFVGWIGLEAPDGNMLPGPGSASTARQTGDAAPVAASGGLVTEWQSTGNGLTVNVVVGSVGVGWTMAAGSIWDARQSPGTGESVAAGAPATQQSSSVTTQTVSLAGSGLVFVNTYASGISQSYINAIITAENFYQSQITTAVTLDYTFNVGNIGTDVGENDQNGITVSYATLKSALTSRAASADQDAAVASIPATDITGGRGFFIQDALAQALGLLPAIATGTDDTVFLNSTDSYFFSQSTPVAGDFDAVSTLEHEISEGMGRVGGLGLPPNDTWGIVDLFRYSASGVRDLTGGADKKNAFFSINGTTLLTQFNNPVLVPGDAADWNPSSTGQQPTPVPGVPNEFDSYGATVPGEVGVVTATDLSVMDIIGWTVTSLSPPPPPLPPPPPPPPPALTAAQINTVYSDVLGRPASAAEQAAWVAAEAASSLSAAQVIADIVNSPEAQDYSWLVVRLYQATFDRVPDSQAGFAANVDAVDPNAGGKISLLQLAADYTASQEFINDYGNLVSQTTTSDPSGMAVFIEALYHNVLGRTGATAEVNAWLATGDTAAQILIGFSNSPEFQADANPAVASLLTINALAETITSGSLFQPAITGASSAQTSAAAQSAGNSSTGTGGMPTASPETQTANLALLSQYAAAGFATTPGPGHGTLVTYTTAQTDTTAPTLLTIPQH